MSADSPRVLRRKAVVGDVIRAKATRRDFEVVEFMRAGRGVKDGHYVGAPVGGGPRHFLYEFEVLVIGKADAALILAAASARDTYPATTNTHPCGCPASVVASTLPGNRAQCSACGAVFTTDQEG